MDHLGDPAVSDSVAAGGGEADRRLSSAPYRGIAALGKAAGFAAAAAVVPVALVVLYASVAVGNRIADAAGAPVAAAAVAAGWIALTSFTIAIADRLNSPSTRSSARAPHE